MCVDNDSRPPITPIAGGSAGSRDLRLTSADGTRLMAYETRASVPITCLVLSIFGGADEGIPQSDVDLFDAACRKAGVEHDLTAYPGAPHSFFDRKQAEFAEASADAWRRVQAFVRPRP